MITYSKIRQISFQLERDGYILSGICEFEPAIEPDNECPGYGPIVSVLELYINGSTNDAIELVSPKIIQVIENHVISMTGD